MFENIQGVPNSQVATTPSLKRPTFIKYCPILGKQRSTDFKNHT